MDLVWEPWLRQVAADGHVGFGLPGSVGLKSIVRGRDYSLPIVFDYDITGTTFAAELRLSPDASGAALATFTATVGAYAEGRSTLTLSLTAAQTNALPADGDFDGIVNLVFDLLWTRPSLPAERIMAGLITVTGKVTA